MELLTFAFEIRDLMFFRALEVADGATREMRLRLVPSDEGFGFEVRSAQGKLTGQMFDLVVANDISALPLALPNRASKACAPGVSV